jgi:hypothetical protein
MDIEIKWKDPIDLIYDSENELIFKFDNLDHIPDEPGIYIFCRMYDEKIIPLYIGRASRLKLRVTQQLNNTRLMKGIENSLSGKKVLLIGELKIRQGQYSKKILDIVEPTLIERFLSEGNELLNKQGTKTAVHTISSSGNRYALKIVPRKMYSKKRNN